MNDSNTEELRILRQQVQDAQEKARLFEEQFSRIRLILINIVKQIPRNYLHDSPYEIQPKLKTGTGKDFTFELMEQ